MCLMGFLIRLAKRALQWAVQLRFYVIYICMSPIFYGKNLYARILGGNYVVQTHANKVQIKTSAWNS